MIVLIDNYDSFTFNLYHQLAQYDEVKVIRNDALTVEEIEALQPNAIVISPGPGNPSEAGICVACIEQLYKKFPILGICLGHQSIGQAFGANVIRANRIMHGKTSTLQYDASGLFEGFEGEVEIMRYHSLVIEPTTLPDTIQVTATATDDGEIMALAHRDYPLFGLQFHPESIGTKEGIRFIENFMQQVKKFEFQKLLLRFEAGEDVRKEILKQAIDTTPYIEKTLQTADDEVVLRLLNEVVSKLPFYVALALHDSVAKLASRQDNIGEAAKRSLNSMQP